MTRGSRRRQQRNDTDATLEDLKRAADGLNDTGDRLAALIEILPEILDEGGTDGTRGRVDPGSAGTAAADRP